MEGGIAIILLLVIVVIAAVVGIAFYVTGGALWFGKTSAKGDKIEGVNGNGNGRPEHKRPTSETLENTNLVGVHHDDDDEQR